MERTDAVNQEITVAAAPKLLTLDEFLELPEDEPALEYEDGRITQKVSPQGEHSAVQGDSTSIFNAFARPNRLGRAFPELRTTFAGRSYVPDLSYYRWERIPRNSRGRIANRFHEPPDIAVEIASPDQSVTALVRRCIWYVSHGVSIALLIDPSDETILLFRSDQIPQVLQGNDPIDLNDVIPGFNVTVADIFAALDLN